MAASNDNHADGTHALYIALSACGDKLLHVDHHMGISVYQLLTFGWQVQVVKSRQSAAVFVCACTKYNRAYDLDFIWTQQVLS